METPKVGQMLQWHSLDGSASGQAVVRAVRSDRMEGLGPEAEDYAAAWLEVVGVQGAKTGEAFALLLATDEKVYLDGTEVEVQGIDARP